PVDSAAVGRDERLAHAAGRQSEEPLILGVGHDLQPFAQSLASAFAEEALKLATPPKLADAPAAGFEHRAPLAQPAAGADQIPGLTIHVHDPEDVREPRTDFLGQRLGHVALVRSE